MGIAAGLAHERIAVGVHERFTYRMILLEAGKEQLAERVSASGELELHVTPKRKDGARKRRGDPAAGVLWSIRDLKT